MNLPKYISLTDYDRSSDYYIRYKMVNDIPKVDYRFLDKALNWQYNPVTISQFALCLYDEYINESDQNKKDIFFKQVNWLASNFTAIDEQNYTIYYNFPNKWYDLTPPWFSGMAQGQIASVFIRAFLLSNDLRYKELAQKFLNLMIRSKEKGGSLILTPEGGYWIEEYVSPKPSMVLNGHLFGLIGLCEYNFIFKDSPYLEICEKIIQSTLKLVHLYEKDNWLIYARDYVTNKCSQKYMGLQVLEAKHLYRLTDLEGFNDIYTRWDGFIDWDKFRRDVRRKNTKLHYIIKNIKGYIKKILYRR